ncbi:conserved hypothetical protein [Rubrivivax sp. A210]|uniref:hypothetical protein n=1 Tax=Rubrivivax sp. A210 TaxID=2772301 RepID=UPI00191B335F|nr:hypothetical protein [Rubrivivax sp. A210]CAD5373883.1 conserved hypothetical protein [Rubrivivax sp. A210]
MTLELVIGFSLLLLLLVLALLWSPWPAWAKLMLVVFASGLYFVADERVHQMWGWPSTDALPERFVLLAAVIEEPTARSKGALYVWLNALENGKPAREPRAYRLPYAKDLHNLLDDGMKKVRQGVSQMGTAEPRSGSRGVSWLRPGNDEQKVKIRDLPTPQLPEK